MPISDPLVGISGWASAGLALGIALRVAVAVSNDQSVNHLPADDGS